MHLPLMQSLALRRCGRSGPACGRTGFLMIQYALDFTMSAALYCPRPETVVSHLQGGQTRCAFAVPFS